MLKAKLSLSYGRSKPSSVLVMDAQSQVQS